MLMAEHQLFENGQDKMSMKKLYPRAWKMLTSKWYGVLLSSEKKENVLIDLVDLSYVRGRESAFRECAEQFSRSLPKSSLYSTEEPFSTH